MVDRNYILTEIRRTAEANGGVPLGRQRFASETGIKANDWLGKYWARWGDAVREAGFEPNKFQGAFDQELLLEQFARFVRDLGRFPVSSEVRR